MLETPEERIRLLRKGFSGKEIEDMYLYANDIRTVCGNILPHHSDILDLTGLADTK